MTPTLPNPDETFESLVVALLRRPPCVDVLSWPGVAPEVDLDDDDPEAHYESSAGLLERLLDLDGVYQEGPFVVLPPMCTDDFPESELCGAAVALLRGRPWPPPESQVRDLGDE